MHPSFLFIYWWTPLLKGVRQFQFRCMWKSLCTLFFIISVGLHAQITVEISLTQNFSPFPGESAVIPIDLRNESNTVQRITFEIQDYLNDCERGYQYLPLSETHDRSLKAFMTLENSELILAPKERRTFLVQVNIPSDYQGASAHACIYVRNTSLLDSIQKPGVIQFAVQIQYVLNFLYTHPAKEAMADLVAREMRIDTSGLGRISMIVFNQGEQATDFTSTLEILNLEGETVYRQPTKRISIQHEQCRELEFVDLGLHPGTYELFLLTETAKGDVFSATDQLIWP